MALPTTGSTVEAGSGFIRETMAPAIEPLKAAGQQLGNPLQTLNAPPAVMAAAAAVGTMFGGDGDAGKPDKKLGKAGDDLSESADELDESAKALGGGDGGGSGSSPGSLLEQILQNTFHLEVMKNLLTDIHKWVGELGDKIVGQRQQPKGAVDEDGKKIGGQWMTKRANQEVGGTKEAPKPKVDAGAKLKAIEARREAARGKKKGGARGKKKGGDEDSPGGIGGALWGLGKGIGAMGKGIGKAIQGFLTGLAMGLAAFGNPMVLAGVAIISLSLPIVALGITAMMKVFEHFNTSFEPMKKFIEALEPLFTFVGKLISEVIESLGKAIGHILKPLAEQLKILIPLFDTFMGTLLGFWESLERVMMALMDSVVEVLQILAPTLEKLANVLMAVLPPLIPIIADIVVAVKMAIDGIVEIFHVISDTILGVIDGVYTGIEKVITAIGTQVTTIFGAIKDLVVEVIDSTVGGIERLAALDGKALEGVGKGLVSIAAGMALLGGGKVVGAIGGIVEGIAGIFGAKNPIDQLLEYGKIGPDIEQAGAAIFGIGKGLSLMGEANLDKLGEQLALVKGPMEELSKIDISGPQAQVFAAMKEAQLQSSEREAAAAAPGGATVVNAPTSNEVNNVSGGQTAIQTQKAIVRGESAVETAAMQAG